MIHYRPKPCIGSGYCCNEAVCIVGVEHHGPHKGPCRSLEWDEEAGRHWCGLVRAGHVSEWELAIGAGCCSPFNPWRQEANEDRTKEAIDGSEQM